MSLDIHLSVVAPNVQLDLDETVYRRDQYLILYLYVYVTMSIWKKFSFLFFIDTRNVGLKYWAIFGQFIFDPFLKFGKCSRIPRYYALGDSYVKFQLMVSAHRWDIIIWPRVVVQKLFYTLSLSLYFLFRYLTLAW